MKIKNIKHIFFDLDHTLWDFDKNSALTFEKIFQLNKVEIDIHRFLSIYESVNLNYWKMYRNSEIDKDKLRYGRLRDTFDTMKHRVEDELIHLLSEDYITHLTTFNHLFEHTVEVLDYLQKNYQLHIITNGFEDTQYKKMTVSNITHYFRTITNAEKAGVKKPNPIIFDYALKLANARPNESIMIGDNYQYAHNYENNFVPHEFLPDEITNTQLYNPGNNQREQAQREFLKQRWKDKYGY